MPEEKSVLVGMSGGIDSTAVCSMLLRQGYRVEGLTLITCDSGLRAAEDAAALAASLGIPHHIADVRDEFRNLVIEPFINDYMSGRTPNPCVNCNPGIKFRLLQEWADRLGCCRIATGHYVKIKKSDGSDGQPRYYIVTGDDDRKDQSYFLWRLTQQQLARIIFPLGGWEKPDVLTYLEENGLQSAAKDGESMEVCFIPGDYRDFLRANVPDIDTRLGGGAFVDSNGRTLGKHCGYPFYTVGQRKGLGLAMGQPVYVCSKSMERNTVTVGPNHALFHRVLRANDWNFFPFPTLTQPIRVKAKTRYRQAEQPATVYPEADGYARVEFDEPQRAITPGQAVVLYDGDLVVGGGTITEVIQ